MGGPIHFVFRDEYDNIHFQEIYTGGMANLFSDFNIKSKSRHFLSNFLEWYEEESIIDSTNGIYPGGGYGLVVLDYKNNVALGHQGFNRLGYIYYSKILMDAEDKENLEKFIESNQIELIERYGKLIWNKNSRTSLKDVFNNLDDDCFSIKLDMSPFTVYNYTNSMLPFKKHLIKLGFKINEEEWENFIKEH